ncbi:EPIDERMAL PATTERNING FACTOR-like protein 1 [Lotus japonicus]|uniref:Epidermal patterning factor-like protein n=1 Tax=Lotus japonicus TaxID=34305 RepID=I3SW38_LOTJA|nr:EPIDERMAL PATTERNING FACTOR-like protein 1 [Lotus japonicus]AFK44480.1 unknown [Lotus japonicus]
MASLNSYQNSTNTIITILLVMVFLLHHLLCPVSCINQPQPAIPPRDQFLDEKNRLGSMPPTCHNKCNQCHPCMAVQVPNLPSHDRVVGPGVPRIASMEGLFLQANNRYSNYKPLSWKCHCGGHFFNP